MTGKKLLGLAVGATLFLGFEPIAEAGPAYAPSAATISSEGVVAPAVTRAGVVHRSTRRTARRVGRRHGY